MYRLPRWLCRLVALGTLALAGVLLASGCRPAEPAESAATAEPADPWVVTTARAEAATFLLFAEWTGESSPHEGYAPAIGVAFYIGNDEWITEGDLGSDYQYAIRQGEYERRGLRPLGDDLRPVRRIGYDAATGINLLEASGDGVPPLRLAAAIPLPCTPVRLAGYWEGSEEGVTAWAAEVAAARRFPDPVACDPAVPPPAGPDRVLDAGPYSQEEYFVPGTVGAALGGVVTEAEIPRLLLYPSDDMTTRAYEDGWWSGAPLVTAGGDVVGLLPSRFDYQAIAAPAVLEAIDRIRAWAASPPDPNACPPGPGPAPPAVAGTPAPPAPPFLLYHALDPTGAACTAGDYAFLATPGDLGTVIGNVGDLAAGTGELRLHPAEVGGTDRSAFYDTISVGDRVDFHVAAEDATCTYRLTITAVTPGTPYVFGFESRIGGSACDLPSDRLSDPHRHLDYGIFRWHPGAGPPAPPPWIQCSTPSWATGTETLWISGGLRVDIPSGITLMDEGTELVPPDDRDPDTDLETTSLCDPTTGSYITFAVDTGAEVERVVHPPSGDPTAGVDLHALFDQIAASVKPDAGLY